MRDDEMMRCRETKPDWIGLTGLADLTAGTALDAQSLPQCWTRAKRSEWEEPAR